MMLSPRGFFNGKARNRELTGGRFLSEGNEMFISGVLQNSRVYSSPGDYMGGFRPSQRGVGSRGWMDNNAENVVYGMGDIWSDLTGAGTAAQITSPGGSPGSPAWLASITDAIKAIAPIVGQVRQIRTGVAPTLTTQVNVGASPQMAAILKVALIGGGVIAGGWMLTKLMKR